MEAVQCKKCRYLLKDKEGYNWCPNKTDDPDIDLIRDCEWYAVKTNADRIRSMTYEELAEWIAYRQGCFERQDKRCSKYGTCRDCWFDWLKEECES